MHNRRLIFQMPVGVSLWHQYWEWDRRDKALRCNFHGGYKYGNKIMDAELGHEHSSARVVIEDARVGVRCFADKLADDFSERCDLVVSKLYLEAMNSNAYLNLWSENRGFKLFLGDLPSGIFPKALLSDASLKYDPEQGITFRAYDKALWSWETSVTLKAREVRPSGNKMGRETLGFRMFSHFLLITDRDHIWCAEQFCGNSSREGVASLIFSDERQELPCTILK